MYSTSKRSIYFHFKICRWNGYKRSRKSITSQKASWKRWLANSTNFKPTHDNIPTMLSSPVVSVEGNSLLIPSASRVHIGTYYCIASNGVPPTKSKTIKLEVQCECSSLLCSPRARHSLWNISQGERGEEEGTMARLSFGNRKRPRKEIPSAHVSALIQVDPLRSLLPLFPYYLKRHLSVGVRFFVILLQEYPTATARTRPRFN